MKKIYLALLTVALGVTVATAQCIIDTANTQFFSPNPDSLPCVVRNEVYSQVIQISVPDSLNLQTFFPQIPIAYEIHIDSLVIDSASGLPTDIGYQPNPANGHLLGGQHGCALVSGTTSDTVGVYPIHLHGTITIQGPPLPIFLPNGLDTTVNLDTLEASSDNPFKASIVVINEGQACYNPAGIKDFSSALNAAIFVYPNPSNGQFELKLNAGGRVNGVINVVDVTGRTIYNSEIDVTGLYSTSIDLRGFARGLYSLNIRTAEGFASKKISIE